MRSLILLIPLLLSATCGLCQPDFLRVQVDTAAGEEAADNSFTLQYYRGVGQFDKRNYAAAEALFRKAFAGKPDEESARYLFYSLRYQGLDMEAEDFRRRHPAFSFALPSLTSRLESVYADAGPRLSANDASDDILYGSAGAFFKPAPKLRLWTALSYLQQDNDLGRYRQYEYFGSLIVYVRKGWYIKPSVHYAYVPYTFVQESSKDVFYTERFRIGPGDTLVYRTNAVQTTTTTSPGYTHCLNAALAVSRRIGPLTFEAEPSVHYLPGKASVNIRYVSAGTTDSFRREHLQGSKPFSESGGSMRDTSYGSTFAQAGFSLSYRLPIPGEPLTIRAAVYGISGDGETSTAFFGSAIFWWHTAFRIYASWLRKGDLPLALHPEGMYFNFNDPIRARISAGFQLFPLRRLTPALTYQYEQDKRLADGARLVYHSVYLTLKYNL